MPVFVGRTAELERLERRLEEAAAGRGSVVFITGEPGAGKSALAEEFQRRVAAEHPDVLVLNADCSEQYGAGEPYQPFVEAFRDILVAAEKRPARRNLKALAMNIAPMWLQVVPVVGDVVSAAMGTVIEVRKEMRQAAPNEEALFFQYTELLFTAADQHPILLFIDDLHWADRATIALFTHLARKVGNERVLMVGTYRPVDVEVTTHPVREAKLELERYGVAEEMPLEALGPAALRDLALAVLGAPPDAELLHWLTQRAGENALFFTELLRWLVEQRIAQQREDEWVLARTPEEIEIPRSAEAVIERRLSRLPPEAYRVLEYASVEGDEFGSTTLAQLLDMDELALEEALDPLVRVHRLIRLTGTRDLPGGDITSVYQFAHSLIQDVLLRGIQGKRRILLHRKMAEILERTYGGDTDAVVHRLAWHYDQGRMPERAYEFGLRAADRARRVYAHPDAIELLRRALRNATTDAQRLEVLDRLGNSLRAAGRLPEAVATLAEAEALTRALGDRARGLMLAQQRLMAERDHGVRPAREILEARSALEREARALNARRELCEILFSAPELPGIGPEECVAMAREALTIAQELGDAALVARAHHVAGAALMHHDPAAAASYLEEALRGSLEIGDEDRAARAQNALAITHVMLGRYDRGAEQFRAAAAAFDRVHDPLLEALVRNNLGALLLRTGQYEDAEVNLRQAIRIFRRMDAGMRLLHPLENLAELRMMRDGPAAALEAWHELLEKARECGHWPSEVIARCGIGLALLETGDLAGASAAHDEAAALLAGEAGWSEAREALCRLGARLADARGDEEGALRHIEAAEAELEARDRYSWASFRLLRGEMLVRRDPAAAAAALADAAAVFRELGAEPLRLRAEAALSAAGGAVVDRP